MNKWVNLDIQTVLFLSQSTYCPSGEWVSRGIGKYKICKPEKGGFPLLCVFATLALPLLVLLSIVSVTKVTLVFIGRESFIIPHFYWLAKFTENLAYWQKVTGYSTVKINFTPTFTLVQGYPTIDYRKCETAIFHLLTVSGQLWIGYQCIYQ